ncbi:hypothetical protein R3P38DRAFT_2788157 [Favolaschia claudopus]|uniref:Uncharacterized protein n=1 Tax=Favolaschia claudopus TaxID=2862362 RepID=A0AAW0AMY4_9AGAR
MPTEFEGTDYELFAELVPRAGCTSSSPINCLLFITEATLLVSGGICTSLQLNLCLSISTHTGDDQIVRLWEVDGGQCVQELRDPRWGQITALSWLPENLDRPPRIFIGTGRGSVSTHPFSIDRIQILALISKSSLYIDAEGGEVTSQAKLRGGIGSAAISTDGRMKAVYNLSNGTFDLYRPMDSSAPIESKLGGPGSGFIKLCIFAEEGHTLVCAGDNATVHLFQLGEMVERKSLLGEGPDAFYAVTVRDVVARAVESEIAYQAYSTLNYHFIAAGETEEPAKIYIWRRPVRI